MIIGLAGTHRSGKSTLARDVATRTGVAYYDGSFGRLAKTLGFNSVAAMTPYERVVMQFAVLERYETEIRAVAGHVITDRTPLDMLAYMLAEIGMHAGLDEGSAHAIVRYRTRCIALTRDLFTDVFLMQPLPVYEVADGKPSGDPAYQMHIQTLIEGAAYAARGTIRILPIDTFDPEERIRAVCRGAWLPPLPPANASDVAAAESLGTVPEPDRNGGYSLGLEYPYIYGDRGQGYEVWHRHTGAIVWRYAGDNLHLAQHHASEVCHQRNGLSLYPGPETLAAIDATP